jgi:hypothetical protein
VPTGVGFAFPDPLFFQATAVHPPRRVKVPLVEALGPTHGIKTQGGQRGENQGITALGFSQRKEFNRRGRSGHKIEKPPGTAPGADLRRIIAN